MHVYKCNAVIHNLSDRSCWRKQSIWVIIDKFVCVCRWSSLSLQACQAVIRRICVISWWKWIKIAPGERIIKMPWTISIIITTVTAHWVRYSRPKFPHVVNHVYTLSPKLLSVIKKLGSGSIFCVFTSVASILIWKDDEYKTWCARTFTFNIGCGRLLVHDISDFWP